MNVCPLPIEQKQIITLAHGGGGSYTQQILEEIILPAFNNASLDLRHDGAFLHLPTSDLVLTTDSFVVQPLFFPGGDIGKLSITGTTNDLAMCGARPYALSCSLIIEEGLAVSDLKRIVESMKSEANGQSVHIVTGDTKVIEGQNRGGLFINTTGIGIRLTEQPIHPGSIEVGDAILLSGDIGRHGMAILGEREGLRFAQPLLSDCAPLFPLVEALLEEKITLHCLRDLTRGGLATALVEIAETAKKNLYIQEAQISISELVSSICEILGFDPLYVANEGRCVAFVPANQSLKALETLQNFSQTRSAAIIGWVGKDSKQAQTILQSSFGTERYLHRLAGEQLPRIC